MAWRKLEEKEDGILDEIHGLFSESKYHELLDEIGEALTFVLTAANVPTTWDAQFEAIVDKLES